MAKHESEMHRQQRELREALRALLFCLDSPNNYVRTAANLMRPSIDKARAVLASQTSCDHGLFGDHSQMDLADRKDVR